MSEFNLKKHGVVLLIIVLVLLGGYLRSYHIGYPVIGYHNWKEVHYLTEARNFARDGFFTNGFFVPTFDYPALSAEGDSASGTHPDTFPLPQIILAILFKIFGVSITLARLLSVLASVLSIPLAFFIGKKLFHRTEWGLLIATLVTINPLFIFFGRNFQLDSFGLFLALLSTYFYFSWTENHNSRSLAWSMFFLGLSTITKYTFLIFAIPMFFSFPWREELKNWKKYIKPSLPLLMIPLWLFYEQIILQSRLLGGISEDFTYDISVLFSSEVQQTLKAYIADNYTMLGWYIALIGIVLFLLNYFFTKEKSWMMKYVLGCIVSLPLFIVLSINKLSGHNYHQYPVAFFIVLFMAYTAIIIAESLREYSPYSTYVFAIILIALLWSPSMESKDRMFNTQFPGLEVAGEYIKSHSVLSEKILFPSGQSYGVLWHADRKGYKNPGTIEGIKDAEVKGATWMYIYQWGFSVAQNVDVWKYVQESYHLEQATFQLGSDGKPQIFSLILKKGGNFSDADINTLAQTHQPVESTYEYSNGVQKLFTISAS